MSGSLHVLGDGFFDGGIVQLRFLRRSGRSMLVVDDMGRAEVLQDVCAGCSKLGFDDGRERWAHAFGGDGRRLGVDVELGWEGAVVALGRTQLLRDGEISDFSQKGRVHGERVRSAQDGVRVPRRTSRGMSKEKFLRVFMADGMDSNAEERRAESSLAEEDDGGGGGFAWSIRNGRHEE